VVVVVVVERESRVTHYATISPEKMPIKVVCMCAMVPYPLKALKQLTAFDCSGDSSILLCSCETKKKQGFCC